MNKIKNPVLFFTLSLSAFVILALASYSLSSAPTPQPDAHESR